MIKVLSVIGTRPEAIKMAPVIMELQKYPEDIHSIVCVTAQHREMLDVVLNMFGIIPDNDLNLMTHNQTLPSLTSRVMMKVSQILDEIAPDALLIQGDTTTVMTASIAAFYKKIPVGHIEAGLRTGNPYSPFPEEINRRLTSVITRFHFAPTKRAKMALLNEGISDDYIYVTGNTVIDALHRILIKPRPPSIQNMLEKIGISQNHKKLILVTAHRRENFGEPLIKICLGLKALVERNEDIAILYPVHMNPNVRKPVFSILSKVKGIHLCDPLDYDVMVHMMSESYLILTDSGGIQEEAPALGKPVLVLRTETERPEAVKEGVAKVIGPCTKAIVKEIENLLYNQNMYNSMARVVNCYGDGKAAIRIVNILRENLRKNIPFKLV
ncbi:MAG: UDP-N-acetylglucosamine 2-epimerase (non-hydrolyzing) [Deltaproteobacteria bacterium]|nr:UDP-N-acetylglucosamine 2-epimerase (non-hydrolyzing) [Deltaproteobacteria bacterium]